MTSTIFSAVIPALSALLGLALTYWINVRTRRKNFVEDLFNNAIAAVAVADASQHYLAGVGRPAGLSETDYRDLQASLIRSGHDNHAKRAGEAREALSRIVQYEPRVRPFYQDSVLTGERPWEIIQLLTEAKSRL